MADKFKTGTYTIKPGDYKSISHPVTTLGDWTSILVRKDLPEDLVYEVTKTLWESRSYIAGIIKDFGGLSPQTALPEGVEAHPGSVKFWKALNKKKDD